jgi:hypothetical protein
MSVTTALWFANGFILVLLYLGLARLYAEVRSLRSAVGPIRRRLPHLQIPAELRGEVRLVAFVDRSCASCEMVARTLEEEAAPVSALVSWEDTPKWRDIAPRVRLEIDPESWRSLAPLDPPALAWLTPTGELADVVLPVTETDVRRALSRWATDTGGRLVP